MLGLGGRTEPLFVTQTLTSNFRAYIPRTLEASERLNQTFLPAFTIQSADGIPTLASHPNIGVDGRIFLPNRLHTCATLSGDERKEFHEAEAFPTPQNRRSSTLYNYSRLKKFTSR